MNAIVFFLFHDINAIRWTSNSVFDCVINCYRAHTNVEARRGKILLIVTTIYLFERNVGHVFELRSGYVNIFFPFFLPFSVFCYVIDALIISSCVFATFLVIEFFVCMKHISCTCMYVRKFVFIWKKKKKNVDFQNAHSYIHTILIVIE